jgi:hypothetical protein
MVESGLTKTVDFHILLIEMGGETKPSILSYFKIIIFVGFDELALRGF